MRFKKLLFSERTKQANKRHSSYSSWDAEKTKNPGLKVKIAECLTFFLSGVLDYHAIKGANTGVLLV